MIAKIQKTAVQAVSFIVIFSLLSSCLSSNEEAFTISKWKSASKDQRRGMADDFLKKYDTKGMTLDQLKEILGPPDYEHDSWMYNLSLNGPPPPGPQPGAVFLKHPQLCIHFKEGVVEKITVCHGLSETDGQMKAEKQFDPRLWRISHPPERLKLVEDLINSSMLIGHNKAEVSRRLGEPDAKSDSHEIEYDLGVRMIDMVTLTFVLGDDGKVTDAEKIEH